MRASELENEIEDMVENPDFEGLKEDDEVMIEELMHEFDVTYERIIEVVEDADDLKLFTYSSSYAITPSRKTNVRLA